MRASQVLYSLGVVGLLLYPVPGHADEGTKQVPDASLADTKISHREEMHAKVEQALQRSVTFEFHETPLHDALAFFKDFTGINVVVDRRAIEEVGVSLNTELSGSMTNVTLKSALRALLGPLDLEAIVKNESLVVTTLQGALDHHHMVVYPVADLVILRRNEGGYSVFGVELADTIERTVSPQSWSSESGTGTIRFDPLTASLVVGQAAMVHDQVRELLEQLRHAKSGLSGSAGKEAGNDVNLEFALAESMAQATKRARESIEKAKSPKARAAEAKARLAEIQVQLAEKQLEAANSKAK